MQRGSCVAVKEQNTKRKGKEEEDEDGKEMSFAIKRHMPFAFVLPADCCSLTGLVESSRVYVVSQSYSSQSVNYAVRKEGGGGRREG